MNKHRRRSDAEWQQLIEQQKRSGLNAIAFCQQQGLCRVIGDGGVKF